MTQSPEAVIKPELLSLLRCPRTHSPLRLATTAEIQQINDRIKASQCTDASDEPVNQPIDAGLVDESAQWCYPICDTIPTLIPEEAIPLASP